MTPEIYIWQSDHSDMKRTHSGIHRLNKYINYTLKQITWQMLQPKLGKTKYKNNCGGQIE